MKKKNVIVICAIAFVIVVVSLGFKMGIKAYEKHVEEERIRNAIIEVELSEDMIADFASKKKVSEFITSINGEIVDDWEIDTSKIGKQKIEFEFVNEEGIKVPYSYDIEVKDRTSPFIWIPSDYYVTTAFSGTIEAKVICVDNYDDEPVCKVEGEYDLKTSGTYELNFHAHDSFGNETNTPFTLHVSRPTSGGAAYVPKPDRYTEMVKLFKNEKTALGIDVSSWQGDIDFERVKKAGVEFAFVRVGSKWGSDGEYFLDSKFERNMKGFEDAGIPVGAYFYSYARNEEEARADALWTIERLKEYKVDLPVAFDFEDWSRYNDYKMSLYRLNRNAKVFIETLKEAGYEGMLYGSISYLNRMWDKDYETVWAAHYTTKADYKDSYKYWQFSSEGIVDGINGFVDLDVMYK